MLKRINAPVLLVLILFLIINCQINLGQTRIKFTRGNRSAKISGIIKAKTARKYILKVKEGQEVIVNLSSRTGNVNASLGGRFESAEIEPLGNQHWKALVTTDYIIYLENEGKATRYEMMVTIK